MFAGTLFVQTMFVPDRETRWNFDMYNFNSEITNPEAVAHLNQLLQPQLYDSYHYLVPTEKYNPQDYLNGCYLNRSRPRILAANNILTQAMEDLNNTLSGKNSLAEEQKYVLLKQLTSISLKKNLFASSEEINDFFMWTFNNFRPIKQEFSTDFMNRWLALTTLNSYAAKKLLNSFLWQQFISDLVKSGATEIPSEFFSKKDIK